MVDINVNESCSSLSQVIVSQCILKFSRTHFVEDAMITSHLVKDVLITSHFIEDVLITTQLCQGYQPNFVNDVLITPHFIEDVLITVDQKSKVDQIII